MERIPSSFLQNHPPTYGHLITILSIDGGGIRGIIPSIILSYLESQLQVYTSFVANHIPILFMKY